LDGKDDVRYAASAGDFCQNRRETVAVSVSVIFKQPLFYFALAGVAAFAVDAWLRRDAEVIRVTEGVRREVATEFTTALSRPPTDDELARGVRTWTETELLFREASQLGLAENDAVIRTHLARKLSQMVAQRSIVDAPTESELSAELEAHRGEYTRPNTFTVSHVFINRSKHADTFAARADDAFRQLDAGAPLESVGDHFPRGPVFERLMPAQLEAALGVKLTNALTPEQRGKWQRLASARGAHFVRLDEIVSGEATVENSRDALIGRLTALAKEAAVRRFIDGLRAKYSVIDESQR
jgi:hypothetical protein